MDTVRRLPSLNDRLSPDRPTAERSAATARCRYLGDLSGAMAGDDSCLGPLWLSRCRLLRTSRPQEPLWHYALGPPAGSRVPDGSCTPHSLTCFTTPYDGSPWMIATLPSTPPTRREFYCRAVRRPRASSYFITTLPVPALTGIRVKRSSQGSQDSAARDRMGKQLR